MTASPKGTPAIPLRNRIPNKKVVWIRTNELRNILTHIPPILLLSISAKFRANDLELRLKLSDNSIPLKLISPEGL